jgi:hypothetical protein
MRLSQSANPLTIAGQYHGNFLHAKDVANHPKTSQLHHYHIPARHQKNIMEKSISSLMRNWRKGKDVNLFRIIKN